MKVVIPGFAGRQAQCRRCRCVVELENLDAKENLRREAVPFSASLGFTFLRGKHYITCPSCGYSIMLFLEYSDPPRESNKFEEVDFLPLSAQAQKAVS